MTALEAFRAAIVETEKLTTRIVDIADLFPGDDGISWGHVGDIGFINKRLREIVDHFYREEQK